MGKNMFLLPYKFTSPPAVFDAGEGNYAVLFATSRPGTARVEVKTPEG